MDQEEDDLLRDSIHGGLSGTDGESRYIACAPQQRSSAHIVPSPQSLSPSHSNKMVRSYLCLVFSRDKNPSHFLKTICCVGKKEIP